jgi:hypothetical protein
MSNQNAFSLLEVVAACLLCGIWMEYLMLEWGMIQKILIHVWQSLGASKAS